MPFGMGSVFLFDSCGGFNTPTLASGLLISAVEIMGMPYFRLQVSGSKALSENRTMHIRSITMRRLLKHSDNVPL